MLYTPQRCEGEEVHTYIPGTASLADLADVGSAVLHPSADIVPTLPPLLYLALPCSTLLYVAKVGATLEVITWNGTDRKFCDIVETGEFDGRGYKCFDLARLFLNA